MQVRNLKVGDTFKLLRLMKGAINKLNKFYEDYLIFYCITFNKYWKVHKDSIFMIEKVELVE